jgi:hypothetical protein
MLPASLRHNYMSTAMDRAREQTGIDFRIDFPIGHHHLRGGPVLHLGAGAHAGPGVAAQKTGG